MLTTEIMPEAEMDAKVRRWGHSMGVVIPKEMAQRLKIQPGDLVHIRIQHDPGRNNSDNLPTWDLAVDYDIDKILEEELLKDMKDDLEG